MVCIFPLLGGGVPIGEGVREADGQERWGGGGHGGWGDPWHGNRRLMSPKSLKKEVCFCSLCFVLCVYEIECFFNRNRMEDLVLLLSYLVGIIFMETNLTESTDGRIVEWCDTVDIWWVISPYIVSPGSVMTRKSERKGEYSISIWNSNFAQVLERFVLLQMLPFSFLKPWMESKHKFVFLEKELHKHQSECIRENFQKTYLNMMMQPTPLCKWLGFFNQ